MSASEFKLERLEPSEADIPESILYGIVALCAPCHGNLNSLFRVRIWIKLNGELIAGAIGIRLVRCHSG